MTDVAAISILALVWSVFVFGVGVWVGIKLRPDDQPRDNHGRFTKGP